MNVLITGASGFIGSFLCEESLKRRYTVWAGMRAKSSRKYLQSEWLNFIKLDMTSPDTLSGQLAAFKAKHGRWDVIIHAAGATKCVHKEDFIRNNFDCTRNLVEALEKQEMRPQQFLYLSSLSVLGPNLDEDNPQPNTAYGESKLMAENYLKRAFNNESLIMNHDPLTIFRPTGVYGPREKDYFQMVKSIDNHFDFCAGFSRQVITFVYVRDLVKAILSAIGNEKAYGKTYAVSDGKEYSSRTYSDLVQKELDKHLVLHINAPLFLLKMVCRTGDFISRKTGKAIVLNNDKYNILSQRDWRCDITPIREDLGYIPEWTLELGVNESVKWYKDNKWL